VIVDSHHHFWDPTRRNYAWMAGDELAPIRRPLGPGDLRPLLQANGVDQTILVQALSDVGETMEFLETATTSDFVAGVVGWVDLTSPSIADTLATLSSDALVGIRHTIFIEPDPKWLQREDVQRGIAAVGEAGLVFDLLYQPREQSAALQTVRRHRNMSFVIDHAALPNIMGDAWDGEWEERLAPFSDEPNVTCKLSGLVDTGWTVERIEPYVRRVVQLFGDERCMWGSDWPISLLAASYDEIVAAMRGILGRNEHIFGETARRVYGLA
jgi:L-fuconolactonase